MRRKGWVLTGTAVLVVVAVTAGYVTVFAVGGLSVWSLLARTRAGWWDGRRALAFRRAVLTLSAIGLPLTAVAVALGARGAGPRVAGPAY